MGFRPDRSALNKLVHVVIDRPLGSVHPNHDDIVYGINYGFVPDVLGGDGEAQDAYVLGVDEPLTEFDGTVIAIIHRLNDVEDKWVVAPDGCDFSNEEILAKTAFQEQYFEIELIRK
ncbi:MAG: inorganic pyrophosphatase [Clostridiales bacterium]|nr:inorganic pyrophosphatase [Clostridiales bacterium]